MPLDPMDYYVSASSPMLSVSRIFRSFSYTKSSSHLAERLTNILLIASFSLAVLKLECNVLDSRCVNQHQYSLF